MNITSWYQLKYIGNEYPIILTLSNSIILENLIKGFEINELDKTVIHNI